ncbi:restriction endonuclease subunit S [Desulfuromonas thiophila]|uniref:restriction endonuclease subunit S n=1 Tax=Desulfuromonas thiophila TaxID=57664 RepID=UPI0024A807A6|nr:restriction endonuclease subunit S [Desulfuromonas thiophila]
MGGESKVGDFVTLQRGTTYKGRLVGKPGPALLGLGSIVPGGGFREGDYKTYGGDCPPKLMLYPGDLFASLKGATKDGKMIGSVARVPESVSSGRLTQDTVKLEFINSDKETSDYLYWILRTPQYRDYCDRHATGSAVVALSRDDFLNYPVPPINATRKRIVSLLEFIEYKIELNRQMNATLEAMAQALFKSWFVDFDPVIDNALAAGNPIPDELQARAEVRAALGDKRKPLPEAIQKQFPSSFVFSEEMGWIPEGWGIVPLKELCTSIQNGATPKRMVSEYWDNGTINWFKTGELTDSVLLASEEKITQEGLLKSSCKLWPANTVLIAIYAAPTVGRLGILTEESASNQACSGLVPKPEVGSHFIFQTLLNARDWLNTVAVGAAQQNISKAVVEGVPAIRVKVPLFSAFNSIVNPFWEKIENQALETASLRCLRDTLLPKLLSGQLRIPDAEKRVTEVV